MRIIEHSQKTSLIQACLWAGLMHYAIWYVQVLGHALQCPSLLDRECMHIDIHMIIGHLVFSGVLRIMDFEAQGGIYHRQEFGSLPGILHVALSLNAVEQPLTVVVLKGILERLRAGPSPKLRISGLHFIFKCLCITAYKTICVMIV